MARTAAAVTLSAAAVALLGLASDVAQAATLTWSATGTATAIGGAGTWDTSAPRWTADGSTWSAWNNASVDTAVFAGTAGTVTLNTGITVGGLTFNTTGYTVTGNTLTIAGGTAAVTVNASAAAIGSTISGSAALQKLGSGTLTLTGANTWTGATTVGGGRLVISNATGFVSSASVNGGTLEFAMSSDVTVSAAAQNITGSGTVVKSGTGTWFTGASGKHVNFNLSAGGLIDIQGGKIQNNFNGTSFGSNQAGVNIASGATLDFFAENGQMDYLTGSGTLQNGYTQGGHSVTIGVAGGSGTFSGVIQNGNGSIPVDLTKAGAGTQVLSGANTYSGGTKLNGGVLTLGSANAIGSAGTISFGGGTLRFSASNTTDYSSRFSTAASQAYSLDTDGQNVAIGTALTSSGGSLAKLGSGTLTLSAANTYTGATTVSGGLLQIGAGSTAGSLASTAVSVSSGATLAFNRSNDLTYGGTISGAGGLAKFGGGVLTLSAANTYTGTTSVTGGSLVGNASSVPTAVSLSNGANLTMNQTSAGARANAISGSGSFTKTGAGTLTLTAANTYTGVTTIDGGTIKLASNVSVILGNAVLRVDASALAGGAYGSVTNAGTGGGSLSASSGSVVVGDGGVSSTGINGHNAFLFGGTNALISSSAYANSGATMTIFSVASANNNAAGSYAGYLSLVSSTTAADWNSVATLAPLALNSTSNQFGPYRNFNPVAGNNTAMPQGYGNAFLTAQTFNGSTSTFSVTDQSGVTTTAGSVASSGTFAITNMALGGRYTGSLGNFWNGNVGEVLIFNSALSAAETDLVRSYLAYKWFGVGSDPVAAGQLPAATALAISNGASFDLNGLNQTIASLADGTGGGGSVTNTGTTASTLTFNPASGATTFGGVIGGGSGAISLVKSGVGRQILTGTNTYTGATTVSAGQLSINGGSINSSSGVTVNGSGAELKYNSATALTAPLTLTQGTLSGTGTIGVAVTSGSGTILSPGNSPGIQNYTSGLTWASGGSYLWEINDWTGSAGTNYDQLAVSGSPLNITATSGGKFTINITSLSGTTAGAASNFDNTSKTFTIATAGSVTGYTGTNQFTLDSSQFTTQNPSATGVWSIDATTGTTVLLKYTVAPSVVSTTYTLAATTGAAAIHVGGTASITSTLTNTGTGTADSIAVSGLGVSVSPSGSVTISPNSGTAANGNGTVVGSGNFTTATAGAYTFTPSVTSATNATIGGAATATGTTTASVTAWNYAAANSISGTVNFGTVLKGTTLTQALVISNTAPTDGYSEKLDAAFGSPTGLASGSGSWSLLAAGGTSTALSVSLASGSAGAAAGSVPVSFTSDGAGTSGLGTTSLGSQTVTLQGTILDPAVASFLTSSTSTTLLVDFFTVNQGDTVSPLSFNLYNLMQTNGYTADLALLNILTGTGNTGAITTTLGTFNNLASGTFNAYTASLSTTTPGSFQNTYTLEFKSANGGVVYGGDSTQTLTLTVQGVVVAAVPEPSTLALAGVGVGIAAAVVRRRRARRSS